MMSMVDADRPRPLFAANIDPLADTPMRSVAAGELTRILKAHELYVEPSQYRHTAEGPDDMPAHIKGALTQTHLAIPVTARGLS